MGVESYGFGGFLDGEVDGYGALVGPWCFGEEVEEGDCVVRWLDAGEFVLAVLESDWYCCLAYSSDKMSRSVAILSCVLEAWLEQCL